jgi:hypothetical protein
MVVFLGLVGAYPPAAFGAQPPALQGVGVSQVTETNAVLGATLDPVDGGAHYQFQIAADPSGFASEILCPAHTEPSINPICTGTYAEGVLPIGEVWAEAQHVELNLNEVGVALQPGSTYYYRVLAARAVGEEEDETIDWEDPTVVSETRGFTTDRGLEPSAPPDLSVPVPKVVPTPILPPRRPGCRKEVRREGKVRCVKPRIPSFCAIPVVRDYGKRLRGLPSGEPLPEALPFGPPQLRAFATRPEENQFIYRGKAPQFRLENTQGGGDLELNWTIEMRVSRPDVFGLPDVVLYNAATTVGTLGRYSTFPFEGAPLLERGPYRIDIVFLDQSANVLGSYFEYVEVVPQMLRARLRLSRRVVGPGGVLRFRLENLGTQEIGYSHFYGLQRFHEGRWASVRLQKKFFAGRRTLPAGRASACQNLRIQRELKPGRYRILKPFSYGFKRALKLQLLSENFLVRDNS